MNEDVCNIVQGSKDPVFKSSVECARNFECQAGCGQILIEGYYPDCFVEIAIRCFKCGAISKTPPLEDGEVLTTIITSVIKGRSYLIASTIDYFPSVIMSAPEAVEKAHGMCRPLGTEVIRPVDVALLDFTRARYVELTSVDYNSQKNVVRKNGPNVRFEYPLTWALESLGRIMEQDESKTSHEALVAIHIIELFNSICDRWAFSHRFPVVAKQFGNKKNFFHTIFSLMAADMLTSDGGSMVGLSLEDQHGVPNPDLYIRRGAAEKFHLEVKAPEEFQIITGSTDEGRIKSRLQKVLKGSSRQINRNSRGVLIVGASIDDNEAVRNLERWMRNLVRSRGAFHSGLAAMVIIVRRSDAEGPFYEMISATNEHYSSFNPWTSS
ncbi:hypothetical protein [Sphingomonas sp. Leaf231]|uniref:hypothetical protein n=1 Tax=Sphingomonas sp. Leaf231 TaxID=1736301 RepID=UPI000AB1D9A7|nr:hypothetical protein [Sphingomonas sp. Leaf231]